jgi:UDP-N-acetylmuramoylalanine--D-glutamate ligase
MELSSFQLDLLSRSPRIACITNITPNHLDRHGTMDAYIAAKRRILDFQSRDDWHVLNADDPITSWMNNGANTAWFSLDVEPQGDGAWLDEYGDLRIRVAAHGIDDRICHRRNLMLMGRHNIANVLAAGAVSAIAGASVDAMRAVATSFAGVPHRLQLVHTVDGVRYFDDSIATAPERLMAALNCFDDPVILLCGGRDKHLPWGQAVELMAGRCKHVVLFGEMAPMVAAEIERRAATGVAAPPHTVRQTLEESVAAAKAMARPGDVVLLSPGGTSYDAFKDFAERGNRFAKLVQGTDGAPAKPGAASSGEDHIAWQP